MFLRAGDFVFVLRPLILVPAWSFYALGVHLAPVRARVELFSVVVQPGFWCMTALLASAYVINQIFDQSSDRCNSKGLFLTHGVFRTRSMIAIGLACFLGASWLFQKVEGAQRIPLAASMLVAFAYSLPPIRLCARRWLDLLANAIGFGGLAFAAGAGGVSDYALAAFLDAAPWMLLVGAVFLHTTILDVDGDAAAGKRTTTVAIGVARSAHLATVLAALAAAMLGWRYFEKAGSLVAMLVAALAFVVVAIANVAVARAEKLDPALRAAARNRASARVVQSITALIALWACVRDPALLLLFVPLAVAARFYYRARFSIRYPG
ncbi:MAG TPA: UbiA family prenyltransferase [Candidatus Krumholzibacteria bacterium]|nr:UbiA family prenyltransferase [Candidatus Krumholzibacteria bacterium]